jgi:hypothetical protein
MQTQAPNVVGAKSRNFVRHTANQSPDLMRNELLLGLIKKSADEVNEVNKLNKLKRTTGGQVSPGMPARRAIGLGPDGTRTDVARARNPRFLFRSCGHETPFYDQKGASKIGDSVLWM